MVRSIKMGQQHKRTNRPAVQVRQMGDRAFQASASFGQPVTPPPAQPTPQKAPMQPTPKPPAARQRQYSYDEMQTMLMNDPDAFNALPQEAQTRYRAYINHRRSPVSALATGYNADVAERNARLAATEAGAGQYLGKMLSEPVHKAAMEAQLGFDVLSGGDPDHEAYQEKIRALEAEIDHEYRRTRSFRATQMPVEGALKLGSMTPIGAGPAALQASGQMAASLAKKGVSLQGQRLGAALTGIGSFVGKGMTKGALTQINKAIQRQYGKDLARMAPEELKAIGDTLLGETLALTPNGIVERIQPPQREK